MSIRFIYFDLDDTLLDHAGAERAALMDVYEANRRHMNGCSFDAVHGHYRRINPEVWRAYSSGEIDKEEARTRRFRLLGEAVPISDASVVQSMPDDYLDRYARHWAPLPGAFEAFRDLAEHVAVGILTNGFAEIQLAKFRRFPELERKAAAVVISETVGYMKPDPRIFEHAAELAGVEPSEILYVGDSIRSDVRGGRNAGWNVAWYRPPSRFPLPPSRIPLPIPDDLPDDLPEDLPEDTHIFSNWPSFVTRVAPLVDREPRREAERSVDQKPSR